MKPLDRFPPDDPRKWLNRARPGCPVQEYREVVTALTQPTNVREDTPPF